MKRERSEKDDFAIKKISDCVQISILRIMQFFLQVLADTITKKIGKCLCIIFLRKKGTKL